MATVSGLGDRLGTCGVSSFEEAKGKTSEAYKCEKESQRNPHPKCDRRIFMRIAATIFDSIIATRFEDFDCIETKISADRRK